jgi:hypothetical protein
MTTTSSNLLSFLDPFLLRVLVIARVRILVGSVLVGATFPSGAVPVWGQIYFVLQPVADRLAGKSLGSRRPDAVLRHGRPLQDDYAVRDLVAAERLVPNVEDWFGHLFQEAYRRRIATRASAEKGFLEKDGAGGLAGAGMILPRSFHSEAWLPCAELPTRLRRPAWYLAH